MNYFSKDITHRYTGHVIVIYTGHTALKIGRTRLASCGSLQLKLFIGFTLPQSFIRRLLRYKIQI